MVDLFYKEESYKIIGICMEVHRVLGKGFNEIIYKDALEIEFSDNKIPYGREVPYTVEYKGRILQRQYFADFVVYGCIILEVKAIGKLGSGDIKQTMNYQASSKIKLGLLVNFGEESLKYQRVVL